jgi:hypothetical protein
MVPKPSQKGLFQEPSNLNPEEMGASDTTAFSFLTMAMVEHLLK